MDEANGCVCSLLVTMVTRTYLINAYRKISPLESPKRCRANGAEDTSPGQRPGFRVPGYIVRPERAEGACAPSERQTFGRYPNPVRCPWASIHRRFQRRETSIRFLRPCKAHSVDP